jgi:ComF family protein
MDVMEAPSLNELSNRRRSGFDSAPRRAALRALGRAAPGLADFALPPLCALCGDRCRGAVLCDPCMNTLPVLAAHCPRCALPSPGGRRCAGCVGRPPRWIAAVAAHAYDYPLDRLVGALKYGRDLSLAVPLGDALASAVQRRCAARPELLVPVPLAAPRQRARGFNQAIEIARVVARRLRIPLAHGLTRTADTPPQAGRSREERLRAMRGAFGCTRPFKEVRVALVDDVMTTGSTLDDAARALVEAGAARVDVWVVARAVGS